MKKLVILLSMIMLSACKDGIFDKSTKTIEFKGFSLEAPSSWRSFELQGIDSQVGGISNGKDELQYDLGWYSYNFKNETESTHIRINTILNGRNALIVKPKKPGKGVIGIYIKIDNLNRFSLSGTSEKEEEILKIFESIRIL